MANRPHQKLRLLHLIKILFEQTDSDRGLTTQELIEELLTAGYEAERKTIYRDIQALNSFGFIIQQKSGKEWFLVSRLFDLNELLFISDLVQKSPTLTRELTSTLLKKIRYFANSNQKKLLQQQDALERAIKLNNEKVLANLEQAHKAIEFIAFSWIFRYCPKINIVSPEKAVKEFNRSIDLAHQLCTEKRKLLSPGKFNELTTFMKKELNALIDRERAGAKFKTEDEFCKVAADLAENWLNSHGIKDDMPHKQPSRLSSGSLYFGTIRRQQYRAYGQTIGDAILFVDPRNYAAEGRVEYFTDRASRYDESKGASFVFEPLPLSSSWSGKYPNKSYFLDKVHHYELKLKPSEKYDQGALYVTRTPTSSRVAVHLNPWMEKAQGNGPLFAIFKHWQRHSYRFS